ncbi:hypothetical protein CEXT_126321 [Caerostris extrusa]|uniref:Ycf15 n=1 Tax=Caerostris extrusa TaxID=172846 RepID=A0AAV4XI42_CAEEX|nr:hypothetical protein CEXT_126321 [Caerostris extrusa]
MKNDLPSRECAIGGMRSFVASNYIVNRPEGCGCPYKQSSASLPSFIVCREKGFARLLLSLSSLVRLSIRVPLLWAISRGLPFTHPSIPLFIAHRDGSSLVRN